MPSPIWQRERRGNNDQTPFICEVPNCMTDGKETPAMYRLGGISDAVVWACQKGGPPVEYVNGQARINENSHRYIAQVLYVAHLMGMARSKEN